MGTSFSFWDANGDKFVILVDSKSRVLENLFFQLKTIPFGGGMCPDVENEILFFVVK